MIRWAAIPFKQCHQLTSLQDFITLIPEIGSFDIVKSNL